MKINFQFPCLTKYLLLTNAEVQAASIIKTEFRSQSSGVSMNYVRVANE
jgi:hypothetical protein